MKVKKYVGFLRGGDEGLEKEKERKGEGRREVCAVYRIIQTE